MTGIDSELSSKFSGGFAVGFDHSRLTQSGGDTGTVTIPRVSAYGSWWSGPYAVDGGILYGYPGFDATRPIAAINQFAKSTDSAQEFTSFLQASYGTNLDGWAISPALGGKYLYLMQTSFTEQGPAGYYYLIQANHTSSLRPFSDLTIAKRFWVTDFVAFVSELKVDYEHEIFDTRRRTIVESSGDAYPWYIPGPGATSSVVDGALSLTLETSKQMRFTISGDYLHSNTTEATTFSAGFEYRL
jgi:hypothetical protein